MTFEICLENLIFYSYHGVFENERAIGTEFRVDVKIYIDVSPQMENDELESTVSYADIFSVVDKEMALPRKLLESVALSISNKLKQRWPQIKGGEIKIEKKHPPIPGMLGSASVKLLF